MGVVIVIAHAVHDRPPVLITSRSRRPFVAEAKRTSGHPRASADRVCCRAGRTCEQSLSRFCETRLSPMVGSAAGCDLRAVRQDRDADEERGEHRRRGYGRPRRGQQPLHYGGLSVVSHVRNSEDYGCGQCRGPGRSSKTEGRQDDSLQRVNRAAFRRVWAQVVVDDVRVKDHRNLLLLQMSPGRRNPQPSPWWQTDLPARGRHGADGLLGRRHRGLGEDAATPSATVTGSEGSRFHRQGRVGAGRHRRCCRRRGSPDQPGGTAAPRSGKAVARSHTPPECLIDR